MKAATWEKELTRARKVHARGKRVKRKWRPKRATRNERLFIQPLTRLEAWENEQTLKANKHVDRSC